MANEQRCNQNNITIEWFKKEGPDPKSDERWGNARTQTNTNVDKDPIQNKPYY